VGGVMALRFYLVDPVQPVWSAAQNPRLGVEVDAIDENGELLLAVATAEFTVCTGPLATSDPNPWAAATR
jgi:hypothetical protein